MPINIFFIISMSISLFLFLFLFNSSQNSTIPVDQKISIGKEKNLSQKRKLASLQQKSWHVCGYIFDQEKEKSCLSVQGQTIVQIQSFYPNFRQDHSQELVYYTEDYILPGLIDLHQDLSNSLLPKWKKAKGQFQHQSEWNSQLVSPDSYFSLNMKPFDQNSPKNFCLSLVWAELKAMVSGVTTLIGPSSSSSPFCQLYLGAENLMQLKNPPPLISSMADPWTNPSHLTDVYLSQILPLIQKYQYTYPEAYEVFLENTGVKAWIYQLIHGPKNLENGYSLLLGKEIKAKKLSLQKAAFIQEWMQKYLHPQVAGKFTLQEIIFFLHHKANARIPIPVKNYIHDFHYGIRKTFISYLEKQQGQLFLPLAVGRADHPLTQGELSMWRTAGLATKHSPLVLLHGTGLSPQDLHFLKEKNFPLIWTPSLDLNLYGTTLDVSAAHQYSIPMALGSTGPFLGSKNLLQELKRADSYLQSINSPLSSQDLFKMVTMNSADILGLSQKIGKISVGHQADFLVVTRQKNGGSFYDQFLKIQEKDIQLLSLRGDPIYGNYGPIIKAARYFQDSRDPQLLPLYKMNTPPQCHFEKFVRHPLLPSLQEVERKLLLAISSHRDHLLSTFPEKSSQMVRQLDPIFPCEEKNKRL